jgi:hypothetical protein
MFAYLWHIFYVDFRSSALHELDSSNSTLYKGAGIQRQNSLPKSKILELSTFTLTCTHHPTPN